MMLRHAISLLFAFAFTAAAQAESFSGTLAFDNGNGLEGDLSFTALDPGDTASSFGAFAGYSQPSSGIYTYLYRVENRSPLGTPTSFGNEHNFIGVDLVTQVDPNGGGIQTIGFDAGNGGESPSAIFPISPDLFSFEFDSAPNYGILPDGGFSAFLRFSSPLAPGSGGGAFITNNTPGADFVQILSGVTTPVPEPGAALLLGLGLVGLAVRRRNQA